MHRRMYVESVLRAAGFVVDGFIFCKRDNERQILIFQQSITEPYRDFSPNTQFEQKT